MAKIEKQDRIDTVDLLFQGLANFVEHGSRRRRRIEIIHGEELAHLFAFSQRLDETLFHNRGDGRITNDSILLFWHMTVQFLLYPLLGAGQADEAHVFDKLLDVAQHGQSSPTLGFLVEKTARD